MTAVTELQKQRQQDQAQINLGAAQGYSVTPNQGSVVPNVMQSQKIYEAMLAQKNSIPNIEPPSEGEIRRESWIASGVMGLLGALVTGNPAAGIAIGMQAALALHDHGYDLRQRAEHVGELHQQGYSALAIEKWYETGDNSELDKERQNMESMARDEASLEMQSERMKQQNDQFNKRVDMDNRRMGDMERQQQRMYDLNSKRLDNMSQIGLAHLNPFMAHLSAPYNDQIKMLGRKQQYLDQLATDIRLMRSGNPAGMNALKTAVAGVDNPNINPKEAAIERISEIGGLGEEAKNYLSEKTGGVMSDEALGQFEQFAAAHQRDTDMERQAIHNKVYAAAKSFVTPDKAGDIADIVAAGGAVDESAPGISGEMEQEQQAGGQQEDGNQNDNSGYPEGTVIHNDQTGETMVMHNGKWVKQ
ncbi:hypothetical protein UJ11_003572 [Salmonella enterica subsp. enterica]|nr:hypothetical protein [Salmonella enterica subsp. enterica serovar Baguida]